MFPIFFLGVLHQKEKLQLSRAAGRPNDRKTLVFPAFTWKSGSVLIARRIARQTLLFRWISGNGAGAGLHRAPAGDAGLLFKTSERLQSVSARFSLLPF